MNQELLMEKRKVILFFLKKNILLSDDMLNQDLDSDFYDLVKEKINSNDFLILNNDLKNLLEKANQIDLNWFELERSKVLLEKKKDDKIYPKFMEYLSDQKRILGEKKKKEEESYGNVKIIFSYQDKKGEREKKKSIKDFISYFNARFNSMEKILQNRQELQNLTLINKIINKKDKENVSFIAMVSDRQITKKTKSIILTMEDQTGEIKVLINQNSPIYEESKDIVLDDIIGITGINNNNMVFANNIIFPDIPLKELKKSKDEAYVIFLSDLHVGSKNFLSDNFNKFLKWINQEIGTEEQKEIAKKVKYIFIIGDLVDGVGIYPEQDLELDIKDIYNQYEECAKLLKQIPNNIPLIICPGNHDANRISEPQLELYKDFSKALYELNNVIMISNPAYVNIHSSENFQGFDVLVYHGYSFDYYVANVDSIRMKGGYNRADLIMKFLLKRRHLAPSYTSTLYMPDKEKDSLIIDKVPDFFCTGHIHKTYVSTYKNTTLICGSCWQSKTIFQERVGHNPEPCKIPIVNLKTRKVKILKF